MSAEILLFGFMADLPNRIRELRMARGWSQDRLASALGCSKMTISDLERGNVGLTVEWMRRIGQVLGVTAGELMSRDDNPLLPEGAERELVDRYRHATAEERQSIERVTEALVAAKAAPHEEAA